MGYKLNFFEKIYYFCINALICAILLDHPELFSVLVNYLTIRELILNNILDFIYIHNYFLHLYFLTFFYICFYFYHNIIILSTKCVVYFRLLILDNIDYYRNYLKLVIDRKQYTIIYGTFTNLNLKNAFIISAIFIFFLYLLNFSELVIGEHIFFLITKSNISNYLFYFKYEIVSYYNFKLITLMSIFLAIILHGTVGFYMFFFDYLKPSRFLLWTLFIYLISVSIFIYFFLIMNENLNINVLDILKIKF